MTTRVEEVESLVGFCPRSDLFMNICNNASHNEWRIIMERLNYVKDQGLLVTNTLLMSDNFWIAVYGPAAVWGQMMDRLALAVNRFDQQLQSGSCWLPLRTSNDAEWTHAHSDNDVSDSE